MGKKLFPYQQQIVDNCNSKSIPLFMSMGTGKTITSLNIYKKNKTPKMLIICLISKMKDWKQDLYDECGIDATILNKGTAKNLALLDNYSNAYIINFESAWRLGTALVKWVDDNTTILIDESHKIKNPSSKIGKYCQRLGMRTDYKIILTGTPQSQGYIDYYNQLYFLGLVAYSFADFKKMYCVYEERLFNGYPVKELVGYKNTNILDSLIKKYCVFYERKVDDEMVPSDVYQYFDKPKIYDTFKRKRVYEDVVADNIGKLFVTSRTICSGNIENYIVDDQKMQWLSDLLECTDDRVVIFYNFNCERDRIIETLENKHIPYSEYSGRVKSFETFQQNEKSVILCQFKAASTGINELAIAHICVIFSPPLEYTDYIQAKKRIDRIGQTQKPLFYHLVCKNTVEESIYDSLKDGKDFDDRMFSEYMKENGYEE